jgi:uncharacterized membrane protein
MKLNKAFKFKKINYFKGSHLIQRIKTVLPSILSIFLAGFTTFFIILYLSLTPIKEENPNYVYNQFYGFILASILTSLAIIFKVRIQNLKYTLSTLSLILIFNFLTQVYSVDSVLSRTTIYYFLQFSVDLYTFTKPFLEILLIIIFAFELSKYGLLLFEKLRPVFAKLSFKTALAINLVFSVGLSLYYGLLMHLHHWSFQSSSIDYSIFDQVLFYLSRFNIPYSTIRGFENIFFDHQHFSILLISPIYWLDRGMNGTLLIWLTPFLLITIPSVLSYFLLRLFAKKIENIKPFASPWFIAFSSFLLWIHPYTISAVSYYFHEIYLVGMFMLAHLIISLYYFIFKRSYVLSGVSFFSLLWLMTKEDQIGFFVVYLLQILIWMSILKIGDKRTYKLYFSVNGIIAFLYGLFLFWFSQGTSPQYRIMYIGSRNYIEHFFLNHQNPFQLIRNLRLFDMYSDFMYQISIGFDIWSFLVFPGSILLNFTKRVLTLSPTYKNVDFQYGADLPVITLVGLIVLSVFLHRWGRGILVKKIFIFNIILVLLGYAALMGRLSYNFYRPFQINNYYSQFKETSMERENFLEITNDLPVDSSVVVAERYATKLSAREKILVWPRSIPGSMHDEILNDYHSYDYWLLPKASYSVYLITYSKNSKKIDVSYREQAERLKEINFEVAGENDDFILLKVSDKTDRSKIREVSKFPF